MYIHVNSYTNLIKYFGLWETDKRTQVRLDFKVDDKDFPADEDILFASYDYENYEGFAFVLFMKDGELYEVNGSHCSCNGLEDQWDPKPTTWKAIAMRKHVDDDKLYTSDCYGMNEFALNMLRNLIRVNV